MRKWTLLAAGVLAVAATVTVRVFVLPSTAGPASTDAVVLLAGDPETRVPLAVQLAEQGTGVLVVSAADGEVNGPARELCSGHGDLEVHCFRPSADDGDDTRAEARAIGDLVEQSGWTRITVVTSVYHVERAGMLVRRCTDAEVVMVAARPTISLPRWGVAIGHEVGGLVAALTDEAC
ncbi:YdcF family protein [Modestobacter excelsi]|uniref:YdcF family protein n=1 Tax=Modestobacter excelsi TaxID=2213161 RepID=UPI001C20D531|nr:ElyC/SanA/YdcF family protein [Modestobacter excelsi]